MRTTRTGGLTLIEVVVAILVLTIGILAVAGLQVSGLTATRSARQIQELNADLRSEMDVWRSRLSQPGIVYDTPTVGGCTTNAPCTAIIAPCVLEGSSLDCTRTSVARPVAHSVVVSIPFEADDAEDHREMTLRSLVVRTEGSNDE